jgi:unsaturated chondroitin disaccharide hydrolase
MSEKWVKAALDGALAKIEKLLARRPGLFLHATADGRYGTCEPYWWTSGFWGGILWEAYRATGDQKFAEAARPISAAIAGCFTDERFYRLHHDVGFQFLPTAVEGYKITGDPADRQRGLLAAGFLMSRYVADGGFLRAWNVPGSERNSIIDSMMNLPLLVWASNEIQDDRFTQIAVTHARTVLNRVMRPDGSVPHIVHFERGVDGKVIEWAEGSQGYAPNSIWARGQVWAIHGFARLHTLTGVPDFLAAAGRVADNYLRLLGETQSFVPNWDFAAPSAQAAPDTSAAAVAAAGLLELATAETLPEAERLYYKTAGLGMLQELAERWTPDTTESLLSGGTEHFPVGRNVNTGLIYGDYYYLACLMNYSTLATK